MLQGNLVTEYAATPDAETAAPAKLAERIGSLDLMRGIAVLGILAANIVAFGQTFSAYMYPEMFLVPTGDESGWMWIAQFVLIDGKMRGIFTVLFGVGLYLFMERAWARGQTRWLQARRLFFLMLFGMGHFFFIWRGDILFYYAVIGFIALLCMGWSAKDQLKVGLLGYVAGAILYAIMMVPLHFIADTPFGDAAAMTETRQGLEESKQEALSDDVVETGLKQSGDYLGFVEHRFVEHWYEPLANVFFFGLESLPLMLIGMGLYRLGFFSGGMDPGRMRFWGWAGLLGGGLLHLLIGLWVQSIGFTYYGTLAAFVGLSVLPRLMMVLGIMALLALYGAGWSGWLAQRLAAAGRAAFTNYLGTSILMLFVFHGWALGLFGELNRPQLYLVVLATWVIMLSWSKPWLERYRYGPLEWLWRCLTYGKLFPLKR
ncbi:uncharacterized protein JN10_0991 [Altererythrobacter ishigakiensis]|uniref:DUF418 domain-containing protein n=1 Tax=Altererythrobacter ishigakiensis TaxID=476157 RepID=A0A562UUQ2_9SPHN|nr:uncharacterized protein JN10_0991 [Altererythrobacter ishigakiensis]